MYIYPLIGLGFVFKIIFCKLAQMFLDMEKIHDLHAIGIAVLHPVPYPCDSIGYENLIVQAFYVLLHLT
jgi:hypothetical protein